jgi:signal transduction histidine kinase
MLGRTPPHSTILVPMGTTAIPARRTGLALMLGWPRVRFTLIISVVLGLLLGIHWESGPPAGIACAVIVGLFAMLVFGVFEQWPKRLPRFLARWVLQVLGVAFAVPWATLVIYIVTTAPGGQALHQNQARNQGFGALIGLGLLIAPWVALGALVRQKEAMARHQALAFNLERSEHERQALDARLRLLQGQVAPHFLFNTLANVQALVDAGSPQASVVLRSLIAYLRAAVPRLNDPTTTLGQEVQLVQAYLELMQMRMPDRLQFAQYVDESAMSLRCPPMTLLTLVENSVRHGIDPTEEGGRIEVYVRRLGDRCVVHVSDTGAGLRPTTGGFGTGLSTLRERLQLTFGGDVQLRVGAHPPRGVVAEVDFPARAAAS